MAMKMEEDSCSARVLPILMFSCCKQESHSSIQGFKHLAKRLRSTFQVIVNKDEISSANLEKVAIVVFGCPQEKFSATELDSLKNFVSKGGSVFFLSNEGGDIKQGTNANDLLQDYGITIKANCLISTVQKRYLHPKEVLVSDAVLCNELHQFANSELQAMDIANVDSPRPHRLEIGVVHTQDTLALSDETFNIIYPRGATLTLQKPAAAILSSGLMAYPVRQPIGAIWQGGKGSGKVLVVGSVAMFEDVWIEKEDNAKLFDFLAFWLSARIFIKMDKISMEELESVELEYAPDIGTLANRLRCCLQCKSAGEEDLIFYILQGASTVGVKPETVGISGGTDTETAKAVLAFMLKEIVDMKSLDQENASALTPAFCE